MPRKVLLVPLGAALFLAGCAAARDRPAPRSPAAPAPATPPAAARAVTTAKPRAIPRPAPPKPLQPAITSDRSQLPALIGEGAAWTSPGFQSLTVNRGSSSQQAVPIFRQAGTLATVRAALAGSPAQPQAEFRNGVLTLKFVRGSNEEIAAAVNKTLSVTGSRNLRVALQP